AAGGGGGGPPAPGCGPRGEAGKDGGQGPPPPASPRATQVRRAQSGQIRSPPQKPPLGSLGSDGGSPGLYPPPPGTPPASVTRSHAGDSAPGPRASNRPGTSLTTVPAWKYEQVASVPETRRRPTPTSGVSSAKPVLRATTLMLRPWRSTATRTGEEPPGASRFLNFAPLPPTVQPAAGSAIDTDPEGDRSSSVAPV